MRYSEKVNYFKILFWIIVVLTSWMFTGCSASFHLRKAKQKAPEWFEDTIVTRTIDTVFIEVPAVEDTVIFETDSIIVHDTVTDVRYKVVRIDPDCDSVFVEVDCPDTEVITKVEVIELPPIVLEPDFWMFAKRWGWTWLVAVALALGFLILRKFF